MGTSEDKYAAVFESKKVRSNIYETGKRDQESPSGIKSEGVGELKVGELGVGELVVSELVVGELGVR